MNQIQPVPGPSQEEFETVSDKIGDLTSLTTNTKNNLVGAVNEVYGNILPLKAYTANSSSAINSITVPALNNGIFLACIIRREVSNNIGYNGIALIRIVENTAVINQKIDAAAIDSVSFSNGYLTVEFKPYCNISLLRLK